jgi:pimeloyl-ACP methyl ester carboxylesterase
MVIIAGMRWVFLPGLDGTGLLLEKVVARAAASAPCTLVRYPTELKGSYQDYVGIVEAAIGCEQPVVLIAESFSGPVAVRLAQAHPNIKAVVLSGSFVSHPRSKLLRHLLPLLQLCLALNRTSSFFIRWLLAGMDAPAELVHTVADAGRRVPASVLSHRLRLALTCNESAAFKALSTPTLLLISAQDRLIPARYSQRLRMFRPKAPVHFFQSPHLILERQPDKAIACISEFLTQVLCK